MSQLYSDHILVFFKSMRIALKDEILHQVDWIHFQQDGNRETMFLISYYLMIACIVFGSFIISKSCRRMSIYLIFAIILNACVDLMVCGMNLEMISEQRVMLDKKTFFSILLIVRYVVVMYLTSILSVAIVFGNKKKND